MGEWKNKTLQGFVNKGSALSSSSMRDGIYPVVAGGLDYAGIHDKFNRFENCITISASGANAGAVRFHKTKIFATDCSTVEWDGIQEYLYYELLRRQQQIFKMQSGLAQPHVYPKDIEKIEIYYPISRTEQSKIAEILNTVDEAINKTRALIEKYKNIKAGMMQDLLGSGDEVPLSQLCQITSGSTPATSDPSYWDGYNVWITPNDLSGITTPFINTSARKLTDSGVKKATRVLLPPNSVIISNRAPVGYCAIVTVPFTFNQGCKGLVCNPDTDPLYLYYYLSKSKSQLERVSSGTTFLELPKKELNRFLIRIPKTINEQQAISEQILAADERIQTERDYLAKLQDIKLGLMQDLLTNTVSVNALL